MQATQFKNAFRLLPSSMPIFLPPEGRKRIVDKVDKLLTLYDEAFRKKAAELITFKDIPALSRLPLSHSGQLAGMSKSNYCRTVGHSLVTFRSLKTPDFE